MIRKRNKEDFVRKGNYLYDFKYNYTDSFCDDWNSKRQKIKIICPVHGVFETTPFDHLKNLKGCPLCEVPSFLLKPIKELVDSYINSLSFDSQINYRSRFKEILECATTISATEKILKSNRLSNVIHYLGIKTFSHKSAKCLLFSDIEKIRNFLKLSFSEKRRKLNEFTIGRKYGEQFKHNSQLPFVKEEKISTCLKNYGVKNPHQNKNIIKKAQDSTYIRFGKFGGLGNRGLRGYKFDSLSFDSSWELYYYLYEKFILGNSIRRGDIFNYKVNNVVKTYECDFKVNNSINVEIKGDQFLNKKGKLVDLYTKKSLTEKHKCMINNKVLLLTYKDIKPIIKKVEDVFPGLVQSCKNKGRIQLTIEKVQK